MLVSIVRCFFRDGEGGREEQRVEACAVQDISGGISCMTNDAGLPGRPKVHERPTSASVVIQRRKRRGRSMRRGLFRSFEKMFVK